ncbi:hypothetical protein DID88_003881 [Monilinia fructigena]|uniref:Uncharacterized protein n=1 Tax=Monilinia fructigena TaxID=38457 RepID=A0A395ITK9_9HELO|nr:hypothetical protein DID88_003881 [Monilinia fructigena]
MLHIFHWPSRKREREDEDELGTSGFGAHRNKRHIANLPHRTSPHAKCQIAPTFTLNPSTPGTTHSHPADSDSEGTPLIVEPTNSYYSWSSSSSTVIKQTYVDVSMHNQGEKCFFKSNV